MPGRDLRVPMAPILAAFGLAITVTRPAPDDDPIATTGIWASQPPDELRPVGTDLQRRDPRKILSIPRDSVLVTFPRGTTILAPELLGGVVKHWQMDGLDRPAQVDEWRVFVKPIADP